MIAKTKVYEFAKQLGIPSQQIMEMAQRLGIDIKNSMSVLGSEEVRNISEYFDKHQTVTRGNVVQSAKCPVLEKRVGVGVIRRRAKTSPPTAVEEGSDATLEEVPEQFSESEQLQEVSPGFEERALVAPEMEVSETEHETVKIGKSAPQKIKPMIKRVAREEIPSGAKEADSGVKGAKEKKVRKKVEKRKNEKVEGLEAEKPSVLEEQVVPDQPIQVVEIATPEREEAFSDKKKRVVPSIIKKIATEKHLSETVGPKLVVEKKAKDVVSTPSQEEIPGLGAGLKRVKEITLSALSPDAMKEAGKRRLLRRQNTVFRSADYLKRELVHARKKKNIASRVLRQTEITTPAEHKRVVGMGEKIVVSEFARQMSVKASAVIKKLMDLGVEVTINDSVDFETATLTSHEFGFEVKQNVFRENDYKKEIDLSKDNLEPRPPVVTIMGHVDHGKTSLLDYIRKAKVAEGEAGGITQHIGAYVVNIPKRGKITFIDTPGHEAFTAMRARGAKLTDIVVLVVSAVDGVMPQTLESVDHAKAAGVPMVVAINKIDLPDANPDQVKRTLSNHNLAPDEWGGDTIYVNVSAKTGAGVDNLLESILLQAEVIELKANFKVSAVGTVIESRVDKNKGCIATLIVKHGILRTGDTVVVGTIFGKVRAMTDTFGKLIKEAGPGDPVAILGLPEAAPVGDEIFVTENEKSARIITSERLNLLKDKDSEKSPRMSLEEMLSGEGDVKELRLIIKSDVQGSIEAIKAAVAKLPEDKVKLKVLHTATGGITESDINLGMASKAVVIGFNIRPDTKALKLAEAEMVQVRTFRIIYELVDEVKKLMEGMLDAILKETIIGNGEVRSVFNIPKIGAIAGSAITSGKVVRGCYMRLTRDSRIVFEGRISSLRRFKEDVREVLQGYECGIGLENFNDLKLGDRFEAYMKEEEKASL